MINIRSRITGPMSGAGILAWLLGTAQALAAEPASLQPPMQFEPNVGQVEPDYEYMARGKGYQVRIDGSSAILQLEGSGGDLQHIGMRVMGDRHGDGTGVMPTGGVTNYYYGNDPAAWRTGIPHFARVRSPTAHQGVNVLWYGNGRELEYDIEMQAGIDPAVVGIEITGAAWKIDDEGALRIDLPDGVLRKSAPIAWQDGADGRTMVAASFRQRDDGRLGVWRQLETRD
jgi:hypothetical protein